MRVAFIVPHIGRKNKKEYVRTWQMEPLAFAMLAGITPPDVDVVLYDERLEDINFNDRVDLVGINIETYTAKRGYEIAREFKERGVPVVFGGYQAALFPEEAMQYGDSIIEGSAEGAWEALLMDVREGKTLRQRYMRAPDIPLCFAMPRRDIFKEKPYFKIACVETGRGCPLRCNFCSIAAATKSTFIRRPIQEIVAEIEYSGRKDIFFVDDNIIGHIPTAKELFRALKRLNVRWVSQGTINMARDDELLHLMADSGCKGVLIGFESLKKSTLEAMDKRVNMVSVKFEDAIKKIHSFGLGIYGTFIFGYDTESLDDVLSTAVWAAEQKLFIAAFNHLLPFPGTPLYRTLEQEGRMRYKKWWLSPEFRYNEVPFHPKQYSHDELREACLAARKKFYSVGSIMCRAANPQIFLAGPKITFSYFMINMLLRKEIEQKNGLPLGNNPFPPEPVMKESL